MTTVDRTRFEHLYLNANSIAEIAFLRALDKASTRPSEATPEQRAAAEALAHQLNNPDPATFDWSALQGVYGFDGPLDAVPETPVESAQPETVRVPSFDEMVGVDDEEDLDAPIDIARYLERVEEARPALQSRIEDRPSLASPLTPDAFTQWLELYESHHDGMQAAVMGIRQLEPLLPG
jgi:hypothetical protein